MAITDKSRKTLWGRSGNRCAMCRTELVAERNEHNRNFNIGDECHIISAQINGPRYTADYKKDFDDYDNLLLLCKNDHKKIDEGWETYTVDLLQSLKTNHEKWIASAIERANGQAKANTPKFLQRLTTGKQIVEIIKEVHAYQFDHDEFKSQDEADFVSGFLQNLQDWGELSGEFEIGRQVQLGYDLNKEIEELEKREFFIFGERKRSRMTNASKNDLGMWDIAVLVVLRQDNPVIIDAEKLAVEFKNSIVNS